MEQRTRAVRKGDSAGDGACNAAIPSEIESSVNLFQPEDFLSVSGKISSRSLELLKKIYDFTKSSENKNSLDDPLGLHTETLKTPIRQKKKKKRQATISKTEAPLTRLITKDFDEDQIWEEVEMQNGLMYENLVTSVSKLLAYKDKITEEDDYDDSGKSASDIDAASDAEDFPPRHKALADNDEDSDFFESDEKYRKRVSKLAKDGKQYPKSIVDDKFFSLAQMTEHIEQVEAEIEKAGAKKSRSEDEDESSGEESIDLFEDMPSDEEKEEDESSKYYYKDFFDPPLDGDKDKEISLEVQDHEEDPDKAPSFDKPKAVRFNLEEEEDSEDDYDNKDDNININEDDNDEEKPDLTQLSNQLSKKITETLSTFEKRKKKIEENIEEIENEALKPKSWKLLGEAKAEGRPENALLEEHLIYDHLIRPAPEITVETTLKLEDVIKQRMKDGVWDDVIRKVKPIEDPREYKKRLVLDADKSKASLAEIYEKEYIEGKKTASGEAEEKEPEDHTQIRRDLTILFSKLDALSHYHFTPKPASAEIKLVANSTAISMEDVAPVSVSDANLLAPQEITDHVKGPMKGKGERTDTDRKRERRKKKKKQHLKRITVEEKARTKGLGLRNIKLADGIVKSHQKDKKSKEDSTGYQKSKELKSSKAFFAKLQESVTSHINTVSKRKSTTQTKEKLSAKRFKL